MTTTTIATTDVVPRTGMRVSVAEFLELELPEPDDKRKMELDDGVLYIMPRPRPRHQFVQRRLCLHCDLYLDSFDEPPAEIQHDGLLALPSQLPRLFSPDLVVILRGGNAVMTDRMVEGVPDIVVEILSSDRNRDLTRKRQVYAEAGIPEYLIFDPYNETVLPLELRAGEYVERPLLTADDVLTTPLLPGFGDTVVRRIPPPQPPAAPLTDRHRYAPPIRQYPHR